MDELVEKIRKRIDYSMLPDHMQDGARLYIENGVPPGHFMTAVLTGASLLTIAGLADTINLAHLVSWARWLYNIPNGAHGSQEKFAAWCQHRGLEGL
jgi:hypothetical protein